MPLRFVFDMWSAYAFFGIHPTVRAPRQLTILNAFTEISEWRKVMPQQSHVQGSEEVRENLKKGIPGGIREDSCLEGSKGLSSDNHHGQGRGPVRAYQC
jgi:hypothetical protein